MVELAERTQDCGRTLVAIGTGEPADRPALSRRMSGGRRRSFDRPLHDHAITADQAAAKNACGELNCGERPRRHRDAPGTEPLHRLHDAAVARHECHVDRKPHEEGVYGVAGRQHECMVCGQPVTSEQPASPRRRVHGKLEHVSHDRTRALVDERTGLRAGSEQAAEKMRHADLISGCRDPRLEDAVAFNVGIVMIGSIGRSGVDCPERNSRKFTVQPCVESRFRNRL